MMLGGKPLCAQISPGALSAPHAFLTGPSHCTDCHDVGKRPPEYKCLNCHTDIRSRIDEKRGLHPSLAGADRSGRSCASCHSDHNGRGFDLIHWDTKVEKFDHRRAGFLLEGRHALLQCRACHNPDKIRPDSAATLSVKDLSRTWLGLPRECRGCHSDEHRGQFSADCSACHDTRSWKGASGFDHGRARFVLAGSHEKLECGKCHARTGEDTSSHVRYRDIPHTDCTPCHRDPHRGAFSAPCSSCHTPLNWKPGNVLSTFNHSKTAFPLQGRHARVGCAGCHDGSDFKRRVAHDRCVDCHRRDPHRGQFHNRTDGGDCSACHTLDGFEPSTFTSERHQESGYALENRHAQVACEKCHLPREAGVVYASLDTSCAACHRDAHEGQLEKTRYRGRCEQCHGTRGFLPSTFTLSRHETTRFPLAGAHGAVVCSECHAAARITGNKGGFRFHVAATSCANCHRDPHNGQFSARMNAAAADGAVQGCEACHVTRSWLDLSRFNHETTRFPLAGMHRAAACASCHRDGADAEESGAGLDWRSVPRVCSGCHTDVHGGQFASEGDCARCHRVFSWRPADFDRDAHAIYPLVGSHRDVPCTGCHVRKEQGPGKSIFVYRGTPRECAGCHRAALSAGAVQR